MYENSSIISFALKFADGLERAYRYSNFCKWGKSFGRGFKSMWNDSIFGQIIDGMFSIEVHRNSIAYKFTTKPFSAFLDFTNDKFSLEQGISESKYIAIIRSKFFFNRKIKADENKYETVFNDSFFMKCLYEFWKGMD